MTKSKRSDEPKASKFQRLRSIPNLILAFELGISFDIWILEFDIGRMLFVIRGR